MLTLSFKVKVSFLGYFTHEVICWQMTLQMFMHFLPFFHFKVGLIECTRISLY